MLSAFKPELEQAGVRLVGVTHQSGSELASFVEGGFWRSDLYHDADGGTYHAAKVTSGSAGLWAFTKLIVQNVMKQSAAFRGVTGATSGNLKGSSLKGSAMLLVDAAEPSKGPLFYQAFAEEPPIGSIFAAVGADDARQHEMQAQAEVKMAEMKAAREAQKAPPP